MRFKPFLNYLTGAWKKRQPLRKKPVQNLHAKPLLEMLERRDLMAAPTILSTGVLPVDGSSTTSGTPIIQVQFSESMTSSALMPGNYVLLGSSGNVVPVNTVTPVAFGAAPANSVFQLAYNGGAQLVVDNYTLFVRGQNLIDLDEGLPMAQPGQLIVANAGRNNVAVVNLPGDGTLGALSNYNLPGVGTVNAGPNAVAFDDLDGDGNQDLMVAKAGTDELAIYLGKPAADGGGFSSLPNLTLALPTSTAINLAHTIVTGDFDNDLHQDIVVANYNNASVTLFLNTSTTAGILSFAAGASTTVDAGPVGLAVRDFDNDGNMDLAVIIDAAATDLSTPTDSVNDYRLNLLPGAGAGAFGALQRFRIGDVAPTGVVIPTSIAAGRINNDTLDDLVVGSTVGAFYLTNASTGPNNFGFTVTAPSLTTSNVRAVQIADMDNDTVPDVIVTTSLNNVEVIRNAGGAAPTFTVAGVFAISAGVAGGLAVGDLDNNGRPDIVVANGAAVGQITVLRNDSARTGAIATATGAGGASPISIVTAAAHGLVTGDQVVIAGVAGFPAANGSFTITVVNPTTFTLNGATTVGSGTGGTWSTLLSITNQGAFNTDATPTGVALGDTNQDGFLDVVTANFTSNDISHLLGRGDTRFQVSTNVALTPTVTAGVAIGDLNGDDIPEIVLINNNGSTGSTFISIMQGQNGGTYGAPVNFAPASGSSGSFNGIVALAIGDFNGDARLDILYVRNGSSSGFESDHEAGFLRNNITIPGATIVASSFTPLDDIDLDDDPNGIAVGDFNKDGKLDFIVPHNGQGGGGGGGGNPDRRGVNVILGNGDGTWQNRQNYLNSEDISGAVVGDFNKDGNLDFIAVEDSNSGSTIFVRYGDGTGNFVDGGSFSTVITNATAIKASDLNGDGFLDIIVSSRSTDLTNSGIAVLLNQLGTGFGTALTTDVVPGTALKTLITNDVNQDGFADAIVTTSLNIQSGSVDSVQSITPNFTVRLSNSNSLNVNDQIQLGTMTGVTGGNGIWTISNISSGFGGRTFTLTGNPNPTTNTYPSSDPGTWTVVTTGITTNSNVFVLIGNGDGTFKSPVPYLAGGTGTPFLAPSYLAATDSPLIRVTTFTSGGTIVSTNLITNGNFELRDLNGEQGNLLGWSTYKLASSPDGSHGGYSMQSSSDSPLSDTTVPTPSGKYAAMLDQADLIPYTEGNNTTNPNAASSYSGTHVLYQDVTIPANATSVSLNLSLYINNTDTVNVPAYSDPLLDPSLDYRTGFNQQVRVDIMGTHPITDASNPATGPIVITSPDHGLLGGEQIQILGVNGNTGANGNNWFITRIDANRFSLNNSLPTGAYTNGGYWTRMFNVNATAPITGATNPLTGPIVIESAAHGLITGTQIQIFGVQGNAGANGIFVITVVDADHFSLNGSTGTGLYTNGGAWSRFNAQNSSFGDVLRNLFITSPTSSVSFSPQISDNNLVAFAGQTIRLRIASANNSGRLIVGVDNVRITPQFSDTVAPTLIDLGVRNPSFFSGSGANQIPHTVDPTLIGIVDDNSSVSGVSFIEFDLNNNGFGGSDDVKTTQFDANGRFSYTIATPKIGTNKIGVRVVDLAGNVFTTTFEFFMQANSVTEWQPIGPQGIDVTGQGVDYTKVSGRVTTTVADLNDPTGNTYFVGSANGGIWKTTDGGYDWTPVTNNVKLNGVDQFVPIGSIVQSRSSPNIFYAGTGVGDQQLGSQAGVGVLKSIDGGNTWNFVGNSNAVMLGARVTKVVVDNNSPNIAYVAVAVNSTGNSGAVYKTIDGGLTWNNILLPQNMFRATGGTIGAGTLLPSVTDMLIDPFNANRLLIGLGNIGLLGSTTTAITTAVGNGSTDVVITTGVNHGLTTGSSVTISGVTGFAAANGTFTITVTSATQFTLNGTNTTTGNGTGGGFTNSAGASNAGLWRTTTKGAVWDQIVGGDGLAIPAPNTIPNSTIPSGAAVGRVTIAMGNGRTGDERYVYVMMTSVPGNNVPPNVDWGSFTQGAGGLYRSTDNLLNFTKVMLKQDFNAGAGLHNFVNINLMAHDAVNAGALVVDSTNPNVVYVGGSEFWRQPSDGPNHNLIRVDTGNMQDTTFRVGGVVINNGDDRDKAQEGRNRAGFYDNIGGTPTTTDPYTGEGVYWYNLTENASGRSGQLTSLPAQISSLAFDSQGRLLVGTSGGIWRGVSYGFGYDKTSGNTGILRSFGGGFGGGGNTSFTTPGMTFTAINGNLQISDMTSVAVDPQNRGVYYTTQYGTGVAGSSQSLVWVSQGLVGPVVNGVNLNIPNAASVLVANPPDGAPADTPITLFRVWQFANSLALSPETSSDNGATWSSVSAPGISVSGNSAGFFPAFAVDPITRIESGIPQNQLLFGTNKVYLSATSGAAWDPLPTSAVPVSSAGGLISSMAFAPDDPIDPDAPKRYYLGTNLGEVFIFSPDIGAGWIQRGAGTLPTTKVNGISVDPNDRNKVFALFDGNTGSQGHVWRSNDAGATWTDVSGTPGGATSLPAAPAYAMVIDPTPNLGAPNGKIYVATQVGVFFSINGGTSWRRLGLGMPNIPVVDLKFSPDLQVLAAATLGRGVYTINTSALSFIPDQVIDEDQTAGPIPFSINDPGNTSFTLTASSDNQALVPTGNITLGGTGPNRTITFTPALHANTPANGVANITITLTSGTFVFSQTFQVTVNFVNYPPSVSNIPTQITLKDQPLTVNFTVGDVETAAGSVTVTAASSDNTVVPNLPANLALSGSGSNRTLTITPAAGVVGSTTISITATDATGGFTVRTFELLVTQVVTLPFADNFNRANSIFLGAGWNVNSGTFTTLTSKAQAGTLGGIGSLNQLSAADVSLQADVFVSLGQDMGLIARYSGSGAKNYYYGRLVSIGNSIFRAEIWKNVNGTFTLLSASTPFVFPPPLLGEPPVTMSARLRFDVVGTSLKLFLDSDIDGPLPSSLVAYANDASFAAPGTAGLISQLGNASADNFAIAAITLLTPTLPFTDAFTQANFSQLSRNWLERAGNFSVSSNQLIANDAGTKLNIATVNGVRTNTTVQADITLLANQEAGVIARYNAAGYYYAQLFFNGTKTTAGIYRVNAAGVKTLLSPAVEVPTNFARIRLEAAGPSLRLYFDNDVAGPNQAVQVLHAYDFNFTSGMSGVRAAKNATIDNFTLNTINLLSPALPFSETFAQADGPLSRNWNDKSGNFAVADNVLRASGAGINTATINGVLTDGAIQIDYVLGNAVNQQVGVVARYGTSLTNPIINTYYLAQILRTAAGAQARIFKVTENTVTKAVTMTPLGAAAPVATGAGTLRLEVAGPSIKLFAGPNATALTLATFAFDSGFTSGTFGVRASTDASAPANATQISAVSLDAIVLTTPAYPFTDDFTQDDDSPLSRNWTERSGNFSVNVADVLVANGAGTNLATINGALTDSSIQADILVGANQAAGVILRYQAVGNRYYYAQIHNVTTVNATTQATTSRTILTLFKVVGTTHTRLAGPITIDTQTAATPAGITYNPYTLRFEAAGTNLKAFQGAVGGPLEMRLFAYDASLPATGLDGIRSIKNATFDNVVVDVITLITPAVPFTDSFSLLDSSQLSRDWVERSGNFTASGAAMVSVGAANMATLNGLSLGDVSVTADVAVGAAQQGGVIARYTAVSATKDQYYFARILSVGAGFKAEILKKTAAGTFTMIASVPVVTGTGTLTFQVVGSSLKLFYTNGGPLTLVAFGYDAAPLAAGSVGIRATKTTANVTIDNFSVDAITLVNPPLPFTDTFDQPDSQLSTNWLERSGNFAVAGNVLTGQGAGTNLATVNGLIAESAAQAEIDVANVLGQHAGLVARFSASGYYLARVTFNGTVYQAAIYKVVGRTLTAVTTPVTVNTGTGTLRFEVAGPSLKLYYTNGGPLALIANGYNTSFTTGASGVLLSKGASTINDYNLSAINLTTPSVPFTDLFNGASGDPISRNWTERAGLFQINGNNELTFTSAAATNTATVNGLALANAAVQADVLIGATVGNQAGLIARYSAAGYYFAVIRRVAGTNTYAPQIYRVVNGVPTRLDSPASPTFTFGAGPTFATIRLEVVGSSLKLFVGPVGGSLTLRAYGNDTKLTGTGTVGVSTLGSTVDNFNVSIITPLTPSLPFTDPFTQAPGSQLSRNWTNRAGNFSALGDMMIGNAVNNIATVNGVNIANGSIDVDVALSVGQFAGGVLRYSISPTGVVSYYYGRIVNLSATSFRAEIWRVGATSVRLASVVVNNGAGASLGVVRFQVVGTSIKLFFGATSSVLNLAAYAYDAVLTTGATGINAARNVLLDNFTASQIVLPPTQSLPFSETFPQNTPTRQLSDNWLERAGNFTFDVAANRMVGKAATNIATLSGVSAADIDVQGVFGLQTIGQSAGLISRYQNAANLYFATISFGTGGIYTVRINRTVNGVTKVIGQATTTVFNGIIRFQTVGTTMRVFLDNSPTAMLTVTDSSITAAGLVGMRTTLGVHAQTFSAI